MHCMKNGLLAFLWLPVLHVQMALAPPHSAAGLSLFTFFIVTGLLPVLSFTQTVRLTNRCGRGVLLVGLTDFCRSPFCLSKVHNLPAECFRRRSVHSVCWNSGSLHSNVSSNVKPSSSSAGIDISHLLIPSSSTMDIPQVLQNEQCLLLFFITLQVNEYLKDVLIQEQKTRETQSVEPAGTSQVGVFFSCGNCT